MLGEWKGEKGGEVRDQEEYAIGRESRQVNVWEKGRESLGVLGEKRGAGRS